MTTVKQEEVVSHYELLKIILDFIGTVIWPITALIIVLIYRKAILRLIDRARKVELPGGLSFETIEEDIKQAKELAIEIKTERKPEVQEFINAGGTKADSKANKRMIELGLTPSPSGLNLDYYRSLADSDPRLALVGLRIDFELMLKNLARGFGVQIPDNAPTSKVISNLLSEGALTTRQYEFVGTIFKIANSAAHGADISREQAYEVLEIGQVLLDDYIAWLEWGFRDISNG